MVPGDYYGQTQPKAKPAVRQLPKNTDFEICTRQSGEKGRSTSLPHWIRAASWRGWSLRGNGARFRLLIARVGIQGNRQRRCLSELAGGRGAVATTPPETVLSNPTPARVAAPLLNASGWNSPLACLHRGTGGGWIAIPARGRNSWPAVPPTGNYFPEIRAAKTQPGSGWSSRQDSARLPELGESRFHQIPDPFEHGVGAIAPFQVLIQSVVPEFNVIRNQANRFFAHFFG